MIRIIPTIITAGASEIFTGHTKKLMDIVLEWPSSALKLLDVTLPTWKVTDVPRGDHPAFRMVGILNIAQSNLEKYALLQELHDDFHVTLPLIGFRAHFRSVLHGYGIPLRLYNGSRNHYSIELAFVYNLDSVTAPADYRRAIVESRKLLVSEVLTAQTHVDDETESIAVDYSDKDNDAVSNFSRTLHDTICLDVSKSRLEMFKNLKVVEETVMFSTRSDNPFVVLNIPVMKEIASKMVSSYINSKSTPQPVKDDPSLSGTTNKPVAESSGTTSEPVTENVADK